jgi:orotidine-5'-phosphate decarboxylase
MSFHARLAESWAGSGSMLCVGLDPDPARLPTPLDGATDGVERFCRGIVDATADLVCAFKPQIAYFASQREEPALERLCAYIREAYPRVVVILDAKRGDVGSTAEHYAREAFDRYGADAVTINPYMGTDSVEPYFAHGGGILAVCRTSNRGGDDFQSLLADGRPVYAHVAERVTTEWAQLGDCGLVVGATYPRELADVRAIAPDLPILVPGIGAQGGDAATVVEHGRGADGKGLMVSSSRAILYASNGSDFAEAARAEAARVAATLRC